MMQIWSITLHGPAGVISSVDTGESQFVIGTETASDVFTVHGEGVMPRHAWVWISEAGLQVEYLGGGTLVNGYQITERVQVEVPASVQVGEVTLVIEVKAVQAAAVSPTPSSLDITIPQRAVTKSKASMEVTIPQRTPTRSSVQKTASTSDSSPQSIAANKAPLTGEYTLVREIARGGMGQIYFGEDPQLGRQVAVKVSSISEEGEDTRFSKEAKVLAQLAHPNIVPIHNIGVDAQGRPFYSMKLVKGRTLQAVLNLIRDGDAAAIKEYPRATLLTIFRKVCDAMMFAHSKGILHRDLKPENIMVGEYGEVLVMDWGLAKVLGEREEQGTSVSRVNDNGDYGMTMEGEVMGTPQYMSPEQAQGMVAELDQRSDIYSLGGILYAVLTLRPPIDGTTLDEVLTKVKNGSISSMVTKRGGKGAVTVGAPTTMGVEVPEALQAVTLKAMATDRNKRYASVEAFAGDIERYQNGFATQAEEAGALKRLLLFIKRNKAVSSAAALFLVAVLAFTVKLAASEQAAKAHEKQALEQMEIARRAEAEARMAVAEAAEADADAELLERELARVPGDLRTSDWKYLQDRVETASFTIEGAEGHAWVGLDDLPSDPDRMVAMRSDGDVFGINLKSGEAESLWKFNPGGSPLGPNHSGPIGVSNDGELIALGYRKGKGFFIEVRKLRDGGLVGQFSSGHEYGYNLLLAGDVCVVRGPNCVDGWDYKKGHQLWQTNGQFADWSTDQKSLLILNRQGTLEKRDPVSGAVLSTGAASVGGFHDWILHNGLGAPDWTRCLLPRGLSHSLRCLNPWSGQVFYEVAPTHGNHASALIPPGKIFAMVGSSSRKTAVLELRNTESGNLCGSFSTFASVLGQGSSPLIRAKPNVVVVKFGASLKIWRFNFIEPAMHLAFWGMDGTRIGNSRLVAVPHNAKVVMFDGVQGDREKSKVAEVPSSYSAYGAISTPDGTRLLTYAHGCVDAYRVGKSALEPLWPKCNSYPKLDGYPLALHPTEDRLWTGSRVFEFFSGRELVKVDREDFNFGSSSVWVGSDRVAEIVQADNSKSKSAGPSREYFQIALWDSNSGKLLTKTPAQHAEWIAISPDALHLAEAGADKRVRIRNGSTLEVEKQFRAHDTELVGVEWHPRLPLLVTVARDGCFRIWNVNDLKKVEEFTSDPIPQQTTGKKLTFLQITPDGKELMLHRTGGSLVFKPGSFGN